MRQRERESHTERERERERESCRRKVREDAGGGERGEKSKRITAVESLSIMILEREKESEERYFGG